MASRAKGYLGKARQAGTLALLIFLANPHSQTAINGDGFAGDILIVD
jgi:hypothetical protein